MADRDFPSSARSSSADSGAGPDPGKARRVVGLRYEPDGELAPQVIAKGSGALAERILAIAEEHGVPVRHDPDLVEMLASAEIGREIPVELYGAVAGLLTFLYRLNEEYKQGARS